VATDRRVTGSGDDTTEERALCALRESANAIAAAVERCLAQWLVGEVKRVLDAWDRIEPAERHRLEGDTAAAAEAGARRVGAALHALARTDPDDQRATPLQIVRTAPREVTQVLSAAAVAPVVRDEFERRSFPDDEYGLVPRTFADLGDDELASLHLTWGAAKATVMRERHEAPEG
jgi:hypothetical protein